LSVEEAVRVMVEETELPFSGEIQVADGGVVSELAVVVAVAGDEVAEMFPTPSKAETA
jgi:hypothetical protein